MKDGAARRRRLYRAGRFERARDHRDPGDSGRRIHRDGFAISPDCGTILYTGIEPCRVSIGTAFLKEETESEERRPHHERIIWFSRKPGW
jgi:hypothetical protein